VGGLAGWLAAQVGASERDPPPVLASMLVGVVGALAAFSLAATMESLAGSPVRWLLWFLGAAVLIAAVRAAGGRRRPAA
jgi:uncharacterized membrane protein YeaQ/YmgE (transglycosylase-associated protein family)